MTDNPLVRKVYNGFQLARFFNLFICLGLLVISPIALCAEHPNLILTKTGVQDIRAHLGKVPVFDNELLKVQQEVDEEIALGIDTPIPKDFSGGYTHERHKRNFIIAQKAGVLYQILQDDKYAKYVRDMLLQYEAMYKTLPIHPQTRSSSRGKLFWQCLNDSNWLVYMAQAYDTVYDYLTEEERQKLETNLFKPFADFISIKNPRFFNRIHNHSTWGTSAVGMIGLAMNDDELVNRALYGLNNKSVKLGQKDANGELLKVDGQGFLANLDVPFSPEGYFTEGPYYQRYAMYPFMIFATALEHSRPEYGVMKRRNGVLIAAVNSLLSLTNKNGEFYPLNDGQKGMSYLASSVVATVDAAYYYGDRDPALLSIAQKQNAVLLDQSGLAVALAIQAGKAKPYRKQSVNYSDGPDGKQGGLAVLRYGDEDFSLVFKYSAQGGSHGHYDKLSYSFYEQGQEVLQDYGLARFVNIEARGGGNYLPENKTWAKQTIAHNTLIQNETSQFGGKSRVSRLHHPDLYFYDASNSRVQVISAKDGNAYPGTKIHRTMAMIKEDSIEKPFILDIVRVTASENNKYDLPFYFKGQVIDTSFEYKQPTNLVPLGRKNGYQHLFLEGESKGLGKGIEQFTYMNNWRYYTITVSTAAQDKLLFTRLGANDPNFNLRRDAGFMMRRENTKDTLFVNVIEPHGSYSPVSELSHNAKSAISNIVVLKNNEHYTAVRVETDSDRELIFLLANSDTSASKEHHLTLEGKAYSWHGVYALKTAVKK